MFPSSPTPPPLPCKMGPPPGLRIDTPPPNPTNALAPGYSSASTSAVSPTTSDSGSFQFPPPLRSRSRNMKKLSLTLSTQSSSSSLAFPPNDTLLDRSTQEGRSRCTSTSSLLYRKEEDGSPTAPYPDGPVEILPKIWLGAEDNVRDWRSLVTKRIGSVLNVAKEVASPFDLLMSAEAPHIPSMEDPQGNPPLGRGTYYPADGTGRPAVHYLKLQWSHGQVDLVQRGFPEAMAFVDQSLARGEGVLIQCVAPQFIRFDKADLKNSNSCTQLSMRHLSFRYFSDRPCHARCCSSFYLGSSRSLGPERDGSGICLCQAEK